MRTMMCGCLWCVVRRPPRTSRRRTVWWLEPRNFNDYPSSIILSNTSGTSGAQINEAMNPPALPTPKVCEPALCDAELGRRGVAPGADEQAEFPHRPSDADDFERRLDGSGLLWNQQPEWRDLFGNDRGGGFIDEGDLRRGQRDGLCGRGEPAVQP